MIKFDEFEQRINELFRNNLKNNVIIQSYNEYYDYYQKIIRPSYNKILY